MTSESWPFAEMRQTHSGVVVLLGDLAYKVKRPVALGFLDFTTVEARREVCAREVALNRRFAPDVYLGVGGLRRPDGEEEPAVVMRRMPDDRRLSHLVRAGATDIDLSDVVRQVARRMATFHLSAARGPEIDREGTRDAIRSRWDASFAQIRESGAHLLDADLVTEIEERVHTFLDGRDALFEKRIAEGCVVDGHGDLLADDVFCLDDGPRILDCLEFDDRLRFVDMLDDVAFLAMDLEWLGAPGLAEQLLDDYLDFTGTIAPASLRHHFIAYRAFVRAKVSCLGGTEVSDSGAAEASGHAELAARHLRAGEVRLVLVGGHPGTGKTTLAHDLADRTGYAVVSSDQVRKELAGLAATTSARAPFGAGIYDEAHTRATYSAMLDRASLLLRHGESVILDATWSRAADRAQAAALADTTVAPLVGVRCVLGDAEAAARIRTRTGISDADEDIASRMRLRADPWPESVPVDTSGSRAAAVEAALAALDGPRPQRRSPIP